MTEQRLLLRRVDVVLSARTVSIGEAILVRISLWGLLVFVFSLRLSETGSEQFPAADVWRTESSARTVNRRFYAQRSNQKCYTELPVVVHMSWNVFTQGLYQFPHPTFRSSLSLMVVWSGSHRESTSAPGTSPPSSCTWCLWKVCISHRTCPVGSPSALMRDKKNKTAVKLVLTWNGMAAQTEDALWAWSTKALCV